jgi:hypothetical protein
MELRPFLLPYSPECVEKVFSEVAPAHVTVASCERWERLGPFGKRVGKE